MRGRVGDDHPGRAGRKLPEALSATLLELFIDLEEVMKADHEVVIIRTRTSMRSKDAEHPLTQPACPAGRMIAWQSYLTAIALQQLDEGVGSDPNARLGQIDVGKNAQDAPAVGRSAGKGIDMEEIIAGSHAQTPSGFLLRSKADPIELPAPAILRQCPGDPLGGCF